RETAPKIISFEIPMDKIGEVIGPKGKVINTIQQETGADINVDDNGVVGTVTIGSKDGAAVTEAQKRIEQILDPPRANVGDVYTGKVVNITKFGAFVNILPGRDGLLHISKLGRGKRVERVEDVLSLGSDIQVRVDDIDPQGKVALSPVGEGNGDEAPSAPQSAGSDRSRPSADRSVDASSASTGGDSREFVSFEAQFEAQAKEKFGDLGPADLAAGRPEGAGDAPRRNRDRDRRRR
ncbi:MAG TPA: S1 RNA-binding domain-containing protein, partial [Acidimicrobiales bacterium]|nr:S1 RNA-binding domain-containing protein [Acidimicrobiales bacterium]